MYFIRKFLSMFPIITTCVLVIAALESLDGYIDPLAPVKVLAAGALTALVTAAVYPYEACSRREFWVRTVIHFVLLLGTMVMLGMWFGWIDLSIIGIGYMSLSVAGVYACVFAVSYFLDKSSADELNRKLAEKRARERDRENIENR